MGERTFAEDVKQLGYGAGQILHGEGILAITKALLQSGVSYVGGYPGAPVSHMIDVLADANDSLLKPMGVYFEQSTGYQRYTVEFYLHYLILAALNGVVIAPEAVAPSGGGGAAAEIAIDWTGSLANAAKVIHGLHGGEKRLVFVDSRARVEKLASTLRALGTRTFV